MTNVNVAQANDNQNFPVVAVGPDVETVVNRARVVCEGRGFNEFEVTHWNSNGPQETVTHTFVDGEWTSNECETCGGPCEDVEVGVCDECSDSF